MRLRSIPRSLGLPCMKLLVLLLLHTAIITLAAPAGFNMAQRASIAGSVMMTQGTYPDSSSKGSSRNFMDLSSNTLESGSTTSVPATAAGSMTSTITAPTGASVMAPIASNELTNTFTFNIDETSLKLYMVGLILVVSFSAMALMIVSVLTCSVARCIRRISEIQNSRQYPGKPQSCSSQTLCGSFRSPM